MKSKRIIVAVLLSALLFAACRPAPPEVIDEIIKLEEAQEKTTQPGQELEKDSIENIFKNTPKQVDLDLGTVKLNGAVRVPDVKEIPILTLERNTIFYNEFEKLLAGIVPEDELDLGKITYNNDNPDEISKEYLYNKCSVFCYPTCPLGIWNDDMVRYVDFPKAETIRLYRGEKVAPEKTYQMNGKQVKLQTVLDYVNDFLSQEELNLRPGYSFQVRTVFPRLMESEDYSSSIKGDYGIEFYIECCYKGVAFDSVYAYANDNWKANRNTSRESENLDIFITDGDCKSIKMLVLANSYQVAGETPTDNRFLTLDAAAGQLKKFLSGDAIFSFDSAELAYDIRYPGHYDLDEEKEKNVKQFTASPVWLFIIDRDDPEIYGDCGRDVRKTYIVDAITGDVSVYNENVFY